MRADILAGVLDSESGGGNRKTWTAEVQSSIAAESGIAGDDWNEQVKEQSLGTEGLLDLGPTRLVGLAYRVATTLRTMFVNVSKAPGEGFKGKAKGGGAWLMGVILGLALTLLRPFYWASFQRRGGRIIVGLAALAFGWGLVTLVVSVPLDSIDPGDVWLPALCAMAPLILGGVVLGRLYASGWWKRLRERRPIV